MTDPINTTPATNLYQPVPPKNVQPRPALLPRQRAGARLAGIISFLALSVGFWMLGVPLTILAVVGLIGAMFSAAGSAFGNLEWYRQGEAIIDQLELGVWLVPLGIIAAVGLVLMVVALFTSVRILRAHDVAKPWPVTWAATGFAIVASWIVSAALSVPLQVVGGAVDDNGAQFSPLGIGTGTGIGTGIGIGIGLMGFLVSIVATAAVGWLSWWLAAHLLRAADSANPAEAPTRNHD